MYNVAIVEDNPEERKLLLSFIKQYSEERDIEFEANEYSDGEEITHSTNGPYDIIFFDIDMPKINGMDAAKNIREKDKNVVIVFITNLSQYAIHGYSVGALDFILKPINYYSFSLRLDRALSRVKKKETKEIVISYQNKIKRIDSGDIYYIEIQNRKLHYHTVDSEYVVRGTMKEVEEELEQYNFVKCNHWYLVNLKYVSEINDNTVIVEDSELEISRRNKTNFVKAVTDYIGSGV